MSSSSPIHEPWRFVEYQCRSCNEWCLVDHAEARAKVRECLTCWRVPELNQERLDWRESSLLWAHRLVASGATSISPDSSEVDDRVDADTSAGEAEAARGAGGANAGAEAEASRKRPPEAGADPEAGAHRRRPPGAGEREAGRKPPGVPLERLPTPEGDI